MDLLRPHNAGFLSSASVAENHVLAFALHAPKRHFDGFKNAAFDARRSPSLQSLSPLHWPPRKRRVKTPYRTPTMLLCCTKRA